MQNSAARPGLFLTFEGGEGAGKTTQIELLAMALRESGEGREVLVTREPGGTRIGDALRNLLKHDPAGENLCPQAEFLLFAASRAQIVREVIHPHLERGGVVICDRFLDSSVVYQGLARALGRSVVEQINAFAVGETLPDTTFFLDLPAEQGLRRITARTDHPAGDRLDRESLDFHENVRAGYLELAKEHRQRIITLDAARSPEEIAADIRELLKQRHGISC
jgi:dTMP kinase